MLMMLPGPGKGLLYPSVNVIPLTAFFFQKKCLFLGSLKLCLFSLRALFKSFDGDYYISLAISWLLGH